MPRKARKLFVGKRFENANLAFREVEVRVWRELVRKDFWAMQRGQIPAGSVLPLYRKDDCSL